MISGTELNEASPWRNEPMRIVKALLAAAVVVLPAAAFAQGTTPTAPDVQKSVEQPAQGATAQDANKDATKAKKPMHTASAQHTTHHGKHTPASHKTTPAPGQWRLAWRQLHRRSRSSRVNPTRQSWKFLCTRWSVTWAPR
jgi:hypothetical protein